MITLYIIVCGLAFSGGSGKSGDSGESGESREGWRDYLPKFWGWSCDVSNYNSLSLRYLPFGNWISGAIEEAYVERLSHKIFLWRGWLSQVYLEQDLWWPHTVSAIVVYLWVEVGYAVEYPLSLWWPPTYLTPDPLPPHFHPPPSPQSMTLTAVPNGYPNPTRYPVFSSLPDPTWFSFENHQVAGNPKYRALLDISGNTRYFGLPATRWFSKLNRVGSGSEENTG